MKIGEFLLEENRITPEQLQNALEIQKLINRLIRRMTEVANGNLSVDNFPEKDVTKSDFFRSG